MKILDNLVWPISVTPTAAPVWRIITLSHPDSCYNQSTSRDLPVLSRPLTRPGLRHILVSTTTNLVSWQPCDVKWNLILIWESNKNLPFSHYTTTVLTVKSHLLFHNFYDSIGNKASNWTCLRYKKKVVSQAVWDLLKVGATLLCFFYSGEQFSRNYISNLKSWWLKLLEWLLLSLVTGGKWSCEVSLNSHPQKI